MCIRDRLRKASRKGIKTMRKDKNWCTQMRKKRTSHTRARACILYDHVFILQTYGYMWMATSWSPDVFTDESNTAVGISQQMLNTHGNEQSCCARDHALRATINCSRVIVRCRLLKLGWIFINSLFRRLIQYSSIVSIQSTVVDTVLKIVHHMVCYTVF